MYLVHLCINLQSTYKSYLPQTNIKGARDCYGGKTCTGRKVLFKFLRLTVVGGIVGESTPPIFTEKGVNVTLKFSSIDDLDLLNRNFMYHYHLN